MNVAAWPAVLRPRVGLFPSPPRGTSSRILKTRLNHKIRRSFANHVEDSPSSWAALADAAVRQNAHKLSQKAQLQQSTLLQPVNPAEEIMVLRNILLTTQRPKTPISPLHPAPSMTTTVPALTRSREHAIRVRNPDTRLNFVLQALRAKDTSSLFNWLTKPVVALESSSEQTQVNETQLRDEARVRTEIIARLPPVLFSEVLRMFDPYVVSKKLDELGDIAVSPAMAQQTPLGFTVNEFGVRKLNIRLLNTLLDICDMREEFLGIAGAPLPNDYLILMRAAGAASNTQISRNLWRKVDMMEGYSEKLHSKLHAEYIRAHFLTERMYVQNDHMRMRVRAVNLHKHKRVLHRSRINMLERQRVRVAWKRTHRFGDNMNAQHSEHLTRVLRGRQQMKKFHQRAARQGMAKDERVAAALIVGFGRSASVLEITRILEREWGVIVQRIPDTNFFSVSGSRPRRPDSITRVTPVLLDAVVQAYCSNNMVSFAMQVVTHISREFNVRIPDRVWFDLLNWAYVSSVPSVNKEWEIAGFPMRVTPPSTVMAVWKTMTSAPYNVKPGVEQYNILIKHMLDNDSSVLPALHVMRKLKPLYKAQLRKQEEAMHLATETRILGYHKNNVAVIRLRRVVAEKWRMWFYFHSWCRRILGRGAEGEMGSELSARLIPRVINEFRPFFHRYTGYAAPSGTITLREPNNNSKLLSEKIAYKIPPIRPETRYVSKFEDPDPHGPPLPLQAYRANFPFEEDPTQQYLESPYQEDESTYTQEAASTTENYEREWGPENVANPEGEGEDTAVTLFDRLMHNQVVDSFGNIVPGDLLRFHQRHLVHDSDLHRIVVRNQAFPNRHVDRAGEQQTVAGKYNTRRLLEREFT